MIRMREERVDWIESVRDSVAGLLHAGPPAIQTVAKERGTSVRTLQRRLAQLQTSYSTVVDEARLQVAIEKLLDPSVKLYELSARLGFADPGSFSRAFKRWTGSSPRDFRKGFARKQARSRGAEAELRGRLPA